MYLRGSPASKGQNHGSANSQWNLSANISKRNELNVKGGHHSILFKFLISSERVLVCKCSDMTWNTLPVQGWSTCRDNLFGPDVMDPFHFAMFDWDQNYSHKGRNRSLQWSPLCYTFVYFIVSKFNQCRISDIIIIIVHIFNCFSNSLHHQHIVVTSINKLRCILFTLKSWWMKFNWASTGKVIVPIFFTTLVVITMKSFLLECHQQILIERVFSKIIREWLLKEIRKVLENVQFVRQKLSLNNFSCSNFFSINF